MILDYGDMSEVVAAVLTMHWPAVDAQADLVWQAAWPSPWGKIVENYYQYYLVVARKKGTLNVQWLFGN